MDMNVTNLILIYTYCLTYVACDMLSGLQARWRQALSEAKSKISFVLSPNDNYRSKVGFFYDRITAEVRER